MNKYIWITASVMLFIGLAIPISHIVKTRWMENNTEAIIPEGYIDDISRLNLTKIDTVIRVPKDKKEIEEQLKKIIKYAKENNLKISIAGAQHSMGGHTIYPNGIVLNMLPYRQMEFDSTNNILTIGSGALWEDALKYLDKYNRSIAIMQAFSSFSIGGSISVNGHGWQKDVPPISESVIAFTIMNDQGNILHCSRDENQELFGLALGGYGLFGIILDVKLKVVDNSALKYKYIRLNPENYVNYYKRYVSENPNVELAFGRLRISEKHFLEEATLNFFERVDTAIPTLTAANSMEIPRLVFRGSVESEYGKRLRWDLETGVNKLSVNAVHSRNQLLNEHVSLIENKDSSSTDLLHEYFIPETNFVAYITDIKPILQNSDIDLLNITIRAVHRDNDSYLNYARQNVFGFVMLFNQKKNRQQEQEMKKLTNQLVDIALKHEGTFYLPYRLHIDREKMRKSYPQADAFFTLKRKYDPTELFNNKFYKHYK